VSTPETVDASAPPRRERGLRSRAGNAMERTRAAVLDGAVRAVDKHGARKATMGDIAMLAGIAKGTLYNHFRDRDAVYAAALDAGVRTLADEAALAAREDLAEALALAAERIGRHPALRRIAADEPVVLAALVTPTDGPIWTAARDGVAAVLAAAGAVTERPGGAAAADPVAVEVVLRWLLSFVTDPGVDVAGQAELVAAAVRADRVAAER
jgi:AcrR family transcriptional regulator